MSRLEPRLPDLLPCLLLAITILGSTTPARAQSLGQEWKGMVDDAERPTPVPAPRPEGRAGITL